MNDYEKFIQDYQKWLNQNTQDGIPPGVLKEVKIQNSGTRLLIIDVPNNPRLNQHPLTFGPLSASCFCDGLVFPEYHFSDDLAAIILEKQAKAMLFSRSCGGEPQLCHFRQFMELFFELTKYAQIWVINMPGSGASIPQHFHIQMLSLFFFNNTKRVDSRLQSLITNIQPLTNKICIDNKRHISLQEILTPLWGLKMEFPETISAAEQATELFHALQRTIRLRSQLRLSYNLLMNTQTPHQMVIVIRDVHKESPFVNGEVYNYLRQRVGQGQADKIFASDNKYWRWGWLESIGCLPTRNLAVLGELGQDPIFWEEIFVRTSLAPAYRETVFRQVKAALSRKNLTIPVFSSASSQQNVLLDKIIDTMRKLERLDMFIQPNLTVSRIHGRDNRYLLLAYHHKADINYQTDPLLFKPATANCFCDLKNFQDTIPLGRSMRVLVETVSDLFQITLFTKDCTTEFSLKNFQNLMSLAHYMRQKDFLGLIVTYLTGAGSSRPQHCYAKIYPLQLVAGEKHDDNTVNLLLRNIKYGERMLINKEKGISIQEMLFPYWGIKITFSSSSTTRQMSEQLYQAVQKEIRFRSQLFLSYNMLISSEDPYAVLVFFKEPSKENPFTLDATRNYIARKTDDTTANKIFSSSNANWQWDWLEPIGGLIARDNSFQNLSTFDFEFWHGLYELLSVPTELRRRIQQQLMLALGYERIGVFLLLDPTSQLHKAVTHILGYDIYNPDQEIESDQWLSSHVGEAKRYGCHITLFDIFRPNTQPGRIVQKIQDTLENKKISQPRFSGTHITSLRDNLSNIVLEFDETTRNSLVHIHQCVSEAIQEFRAKIVEPEFLEIAENFPQFKNCLPAFKKFGVPYLPEDYLPHISLLSSIEHSVSASENLPQQIRRYLDAHYGSYFKASGELALYLVKENYWKSRWEIFQRIRF